MKIFAVIHNYGAPSARSVLGDGPVCWYTIPDSAVLHTGNPLFVPTDDDVRMEAFASVAYRCERLGKSISPRFAGRYFRAVTAAFTVIDTRRLAALREAGMPWSGAVTSDRSCVLGNFRPISTLDYNGGFRVTYDGVTTDYDPGRIRLAMDRLAPLLSADVTFKTGDIVLAAVSPEGTVLRPGTRLTATDIDTETNLIDINIR